MSFKEKYTSGRGLDAANAGWAGPGWRGAFAPKVDAVMNTDTAMEANVPYVVGTLPRGFDMRKACLDVRKASLAGALTVQVKRKSTGAVVWAPFPAPVSMASVATTYGTATAPGPLVEESELVITANAVVEGAVFSLEIVGDVMRVPFGRELENQQW